MAFSAWFGVSVVGVFTTLKTYLWCLLVTLWRILLHEIEVVWECVRPKRTFVVPTESGKVRGYKRGTALVCRGIPYADSVEGAYRWKAPRPPQPWKDVRDCKNFSPCFPQDQTGMVTSSFSLTRCVLMGIAKGFLRITGLVRNHKGSEKDALTINVCSPFNHVQMTNSVNPPAQLPVLVFVHGGGFYLGSGGAPFYKGNEMTEKNCVLVTMNYRLGVVGFLNVPGCDTNRGHLDQLCALQWVHDNIANFGGDKNNVTIFGESAGGMSCANLMGSPLRKTPEGKQLFRKVICMSGAAHNVHSLQRSEEIFEEVLGNLPKGSTRESLDTVPYSVLHSAMMKFIWKHRRAYDTNRAADVIGLGPHIDNLVLPKHPLQAVKDGDANDLMLLAGTTKHEYTLFTSFLQPHRPLTSMLPDRLESWMSNTATYNCAHDISETKQRLLAAYLTSDYSKTFPGFTYHKEYNAAVTDWEFRIPCERLAHVHNTAGGHARVYLYQPTLNETYGCCHGSELMPLFGTHKFLPFIFDENAGDTCGEIFRDVVAEFSKGDLCTNSWPKFDSTNRNVMELGANKSLLSNPDSDIINRWGDLARFDKRIL